MAFLFNSAGILKQDWCSLLSSCNSKKHSNDSKRDFNNSNDLENDLENLLNNDLEDRRVTWKRRTISFNWCKWMQDNFKSISISRTKGISGNFLCYLWFISCQSNPMHSLELSFQIHHLDRAKLPYGNRHRTKAIIWTVYSPFPQKWPICQWWEICQDIS